MAQLLALFCQCNIHGMAYAADHLTRKFPAGEVLRTLIVTSYAALPMLVKVVKYLMTTVCTSLVRVEMDMKILMCPALKLYLALGLKVIDLTAFLSFCPIRLKYQYLKSAVIRISQFTPNIEELLLSSKTPRYFRKFDSIVDAEMLKALYQLTSLRVLQLDEWCCFEITDVFQLCEKLPGLQILSINFPDSFDDFDDLINDRVKCAALLKRSMSNLKEFIYTARNNCILRIECMRMRNLSNLHVLHQYSELFCPKEDYDPSTPNEVVPGYSNLRHLTIHINLTYDYPDNEIHIKHPHVTDLMMHWYEDPDWDWECLNYILQFTNIESLTMLDFPTVVMFRFIDTFGAKLNALNIQHDDRQMEPFLNLNHIFTACPLLERLRLWLVINDPEPITFYARLKEVELNFSFRSPDGSRDEVVNILSAPDLEKVILSDPCFEDLVKLTSKVAEKEILQKLKTLVIELDVDSLALIVNLDQFNGIVEFIKCAAACLINLTNLKFYLNDRRRADYLHKSLGGNATTEINPLSSFFRREQFFLSRGPNFHLSTKRMGKNQGNQMNPKALFDNKHRADVKFALQAKLGREPTKAEIQEKLDEAWAQYLETKRKKKRTRHDDDDNNEPPKYLI
ncbi:Hypothetical predicted protein [Cloeon dipterum]|uniref:Uncharacterized protein n=1 Tax=Cloeon dipterum TaxID=197152 RepID=A0A8S1DNW1_9INSE|nr:Hypothetical predicted protein [Cloeon dipterum]